MTSSPHSPHPHPATAAIAMVRYSLPELLDELKLERVTGGFGMEKLQQEEIGKLFQTQAKRRRAPTP
ncbi:hypothetical protein DB347_10465 [Opitutaceae bacterium EW11]|nr:hypothetical protein DB347_10465 [Opitutaceae bacterium EW11]